MDIDEKTLEELSKLIKSIKDINKDTICAIFETLKHDRFCPCRDVKVSFETFNKPSSANFKKDELQVNPEYLYTYSVKWVNKEFSNEAEEIKEIILRYFAAYIIMHEYFHFDEHALAIYGGRYKEVHHLYYNMFFDIVHYDQYKSNYAKYPEQFCHERHANLCASYNLIKISPKVMAEKLKEMYLKHFIRNYSFEGYKRMTPARKTYEMMGIFYFADSHFAEKYYTPLLERLIHGLDISLMEYQDIILPIKKSTDSHKAYEELQLKLTS